MATVVRSAVLLVASCILFGCGAARDRGSNNTKTRCPKSEEKFSTRLSNCYRPLHTNFHIDRPEEYCPRYLAILKCAERLIKQCEDQDYMQARRQELEEQVLQGLRQALTGCPTTTTTTTTSNNNHWLAHLQQQQQH